MLPIDCSPLNRSAGISIGGSIFIAAIITGVESAGGVDKIFGGVPQATVISDTIERINRRG
jgi:hypothetical protein